VAIRPGQTSCLETMFFVDEVRSPVDELPNLPHAEDPSDREVRMAELLSNPWRAHGIRSATKHHTVKRSKPHRREASRQDHRRLGFAPVPSG